MSPDEASALAPVIRQIALEAVRECSLDEAVADVLLRDARIANRYTEARDLMLWAIGSIGGGKDREVAAAVGLTRLTLIKARERMRHRRRHEQWYTRSERFIQFLASDETFAARIRRAVYEAGASSRRTGRMQ